MSVMQNSPRERTVMEHKVADHAFAHNFSFDFQLLDLSGQVIDGMNIANRGHGRC